MNETNIVEKKNMVKFFIVTIPQSHVIFRLEFTRKVLHCK